MLGIFYFIQISPYINLILMITSQFAGMPVRFIAQSPQLFKIFQINVLLSKFNIYDYFGSAFLLCRIKYSIFFISKCLFGKILNLCHSQHKRSTKHSIGHRIIYDILPSVRQLSIINCYQCATIIAKFRLIENDSKRPRYSLKSNINVSEV